MNYINYIFTYFCGILCGVIIGMLVHSNKNNTYDDACRMSDCIRYTLANDSNKTIKEACKLFLWDNAIEDRIVPLKDYSYCY